MCYATSNEFCPYCVWTKLKNIQKGKKGKRVIPVNRHFFFNCGDAEIDMEHETSPMSDARFRALLRLAYTAIGAVVSIAALVVAGPLALFAIIVVVLVALCTAVD